MCAYAYVYMYVCMQICAPRLTAGSASRWVNRARTKQEINMVIRAVEKNFTVKYVFSFSEKYFSIYLYLFFSSIIHSTNQFCSYCCNNYYFFLWFFFPAYRLIDDNDYKLVLSCLIILYLPHLWHIAHVALAFLRVVQLNSSHSRHLRSFFNLIALNLFALHKHLAHSGCDFNSLKVAN